MFPANGLPIQIPIRKLPQKFKMNLWLPKISSDLAQKLEWATLALG
jgi:hypothetical protein